MSDSQVDNFEWARSAEAVKPVDLRTDLPHSARMYDYYLGGKDNYPADREAAEKTLAVLPNARIVTAEGRAFMHRTTRYLAREAGIRQFLDIGTGIPTSPNLHEVAQAIAPDARVLYVDNDPIVLTHARALLTGTPTGRTAYLDADLRQPEKILDSAELADTLDLSKPVALSLIGIFHFIPDTDDPYGLIRAYLDALPSGSYLTLSQFTADLAPEEAARAAEVYHRSGLPAVARSREQIARFFDGLEPVDPGVALIHRWRPDAAGTADEPTDAQVSVYGALARKP